ncbi:hypothetical protein ACNF49_14295 [Actinomadura sp. ATCC 39365]
MWIRLAVAITVIYTASPAGCGAPASTTHPSGKHGCASSWAPIVAVQLGHAEPKVRASLRIKCDQAVLSSFYARISIDHKDGLFDEWFEVSRDFYTQPPGLAHSYPLLSAPCRAGSYRARASITGTFVNGDPYKVTDETSNDRVNCDKPKPVT